jgi:alkanesulfonate monooxygenase SsuD/methylene tetrahydromethanopterin reductase-like flavin-dependent oxidoreductase (luciferase family)
LESVAAVGEWSASDALLQPIELAEAVEALGADGAYFRVHHFAPAWLCSWRVA